MSSTKACLSQLVVPHRTQKKNHTDVSLLANILRKYYTRCLFFCCMWLYTVSGPSCHLRTCCVCHVVANSEHRKLKNLSSGCPPKAFWRQVISFDSWNLGHREQDYRRRLRLSRSAFVWVVALRGLVCYRRFEKTSCRFLCSRVRMSLESDEFKYIAAKAWFMAYVLWHKVGRLWRRRLAPAVTEQGPLKGLVSTALNRQRGILRPAVSVSFSRTLLRESS
jgi:hypothetical protein